MILVDGARQNDSGTGNNLTGHSSTQPDFDFVRAEHATGFESIPDARHCRVIVYLRGLCWLVVDRVTVDQPRTLDALWHFHPDCTVKTEGLSAASTDEDKGNLRIVPIGGPNWKLDIIKGQETPTIQGWYSPEYNVKHPNSTAVYQAKISKAATFSWLLLPAKGTVPEVRAECMSAPDGAARIRFTLPDKKAYEVAVRLDGKESVALSEGLRLEGDCAILGLGEGPRVACGRIVNDKD